MDFRLVPGVLLSNRPIPSASAALTDIASKLLALQELPQPAEMKGKSLRAAALRCQAGTVACTLSERRRRITCLAENFPSGGIFTGS